MTDKSKVRAETLFSQKTSGDYATNDEALRAGKMFSDEWEKVFSDYAEWIHPTESTESRLMGQHVPFVIEFTDGSAIHIDMDKTYDTETDFKKEVIVTLVDTEGWVRESYQYTLGLDGTVRRHDTQEPHTLNKLRRPSSNDYNAVLDNELANWALEQQLGLNNQLVDEVEVDKLFTLVNEAEARDFSD